MSLQQPIASTTTHRLYNDPCVYTAAPAYIAETAPPSVRGLLISLKEAFIVGGILLGYLASYGFVDTVGGWRWMYGVPTAAAMVLAAGMVCVWGGWAMQYAHQQ